MFAPVAQTERTALGLSEDHAAPLVPPRIERVTIPELEEFVLGELGRVRRRPLMQRTRGLSAGD